VRLAAIILSAALLAAPATAQTRAQIELCTVIGEAAESIMTDRQNGISMSQMMRLADGFDIIQALIMSAFSVPRLYSLGDRRAAISGFREGAENTCFVYAGEPA